MGKTGQPEWAKRILKLLEQAKKKDPDFERFGAGSHHYKLAAPAGEEKIKKFEEQFQIRLPEEYRDFLTWIGDGGAGPYYGLYGLKALKEELQDSCTYNVQSEPVIYPKMSDEDWEKAADPEGRREGEEAHPYVGLLPIGSQGCTLMTGLVLMGPYKGQVVYYDEDFCGKPFFMREKGFLAWYERWLREVIAGYDDEETDFGLNLDGDPRQLTQLYERAVNSEEKTEIIDSFYKFQSLPDRQKTYFKQICSRESDMEVRMRLIKMMMHFHVTGMTEEMERLWECGAYGEAVSIAACEGGLRVKEQWYERIFEKLPELHGDAFRDACFIFRTMKDAPDVHAGRLREALAREDLDINERTALFCCIRELREREEALDYFLKYLPVEKDVSLLIYAIQAMDGVKDPRLQEIYVELLEKYKTHENAKLDYEGSQMVLRGGSCVGAGRPQGQLVSSLMNQFDLFGLDYRGAWKLLMDDRRWAEWKRQNQFL